MSSNSAENLALKKKKKKNKEAGNSSISKAQRIFSQDQSNKEAAKFKNIARTGNKSISLS